MAMLQVNDLPPIEVEERSYAIGGKLLTAKMMVSEFEALANNEDLKQSVRKNLVEALVEQILSDKLCEFTTYTDAILMGQMVVARCYLAPSDQVRLLRVHTIK